MNRATVKELSMMMERLKDSIPSTSVGKGIAVEPMTAEPTPVEQGMEFSEGMAPRWRDAARILATGAIRAAQADKRPSTPSPKQPPSGAVAKEH